MLAVYAALSARGDHAHTSGVEVHEPARRQAVSPHERLATRHLNVLMTADAPETADRDAADEEKVRTHAAEVQGQEKKDAAAVRAARGADEAEKSANGEFLQCTMTVSPSSTALWPCVIPIGSKEHELSDLHSGCLNVSTDVMLPGVQMHLDRLYTYDVIPSAVYGGSLLVVPHRLPAGLDLEFDCSGPGTDEGAPATFFVIAHSGENAHDGGLTTPLDWRVSQDAGWRRSAVAPQYDLADVCGCGPHGLNMSMWGLTFRGATHIRIPSTTQDDGAISFVLVSHGNASFTPRLNDRRLPADSTPQPPPSTWLRDVTLAPHYPNPGWQD